MKLVPSHLLDKIGFEAVREATLRHVYSPMGRERIERMEPSDDRETVDRQLSETDEMMRLLDNDDPFPLYRVDDISSQLNRADAEGSVLPQESFPRIAELLGVIRKVKNYLVERQERYPVLYDISRELVALGELEERIQEVFDDNGEVRSDASPQLKKIHRELNQRRGDLRNTINRVMARANKEGFTSDEGPTLRSGRMVIPVRAEHKRKIEGFVHDVSGSGQTVYLEPAEALNINNDIRQLEASEREEIKRILSRLTNEVRKQAPKIRRNLKTIGYIDAIAARARLSLRLDAEIPALSEDQSINLEQAYNPHLKLRNQQRDNKEKEEIVPLDLHLERGEQCLMITGPNAGGKSVAMKTVGLCGVMMQSGYAIPASSASYLPLLSGMFVDMGDDQSIEDDLSTFSSRLEWMRDAVEQCDERSLVLIDEAGAGTDPEEAGALFQSLIEKLIDRGARVIVTTHHGSLKVFAHEHPQAINGSMEFDQQSLAPTYRFQKGVPGSSYAFEIARRMRLSDEVLDRAAELVGENKSDLESLINDLKQRTQEAEELTRKYDKLQDEMEEQKEQYEKRREKMEREKEKIKEEALRKAEKIVSEANQRIERAVEQISKQGQQDKEKVKEARQRVEDYKEEVTDELEDIEKRKREQKKKDEGLESPEVGDRVRLMDNNMTGELVQVSGNKAVVQANGLKVNTEYDRLVKLKESDKKKSRRPKIKTQTSNPDSATISKPKTNLEIRGMRAEEARQELQRYIDQAVATNLEEVEIIHGKGQGILRQITHEYLKDRSEVKDFDIAPLDRGGSGCTIVHLK